MRQERRIFMSSYCINGIDDLKVYSPQVSGGEVEAATSMFNVYQFSSRSNPEIVLATSIPLPLYPELYSDGYVQFFNLFFCLSDGVVDVSNCHAENLLAENFRKFLDIVV